MAAGVDGGCFRVWWGGLVGWPPVGWGLVDDGVGTGIGLGGGGLVVVADGC